MIINQLQLLFSCVYVDTSRRIVNSIGYPQWLQITGYWLAHNRSYNIYQFIIVITTQWIHPKWCAATCRDCPSSSTLYQLIYWLYGVVSTTHNGRTVLPWPHIGSKLYFVSQNSETYSHSAVAQIKFYTNKPITARPLNSRTLIRWQSGQLNQETLRQSLHCIVVQPCPAYYAKL